MTVQSVTRLLAGIVVLVSLALAHWVSPNWLWLTAFVGLNLLQSGVTDWCPAMTILRMMKLPEAGSAKCS